MYCPRCAANSVDEARFCRACGATLDSGLQRRAGKPPVISEAEVLAHDFGRATQTQGNRARLDVSLHRSQLHSHGFPIEVNTRRYLMVVLDVPCSCSHVRNGCSSTCEGTKRTKDFAVLKVEHTYELGTSGKRNIIS
jgi:hypothetical protein